MKSFKKVSRKSKELTFKGWLLWIYHEYHLEYSQLNSVTMNLVDVKLSSEDRIP